MPDYGPVLLTVVGDEFIEPCRIAQIIWQGATTSGDTVAIHGRGQNPAVLWEGRTDTTQTYLGITFSSSGLHAPTGFKLVSLSAGRVLVYILES